MEQNRNKPYQYRQYYRSTQVVARQQQSGPKRPALLFFGVLGCMVFLFGLSGYRWISGHIESLPLVSAAQSEPNNPPPKPVHIPDIANLESRIAAVVAANPSMQISVSINDLAAAKSYSYGVNEPFLAASTAKLLTAIFFLSEVEKGKYNLNTNIAGQSATVQLQKMIELSDNTAWVGFNGLLGKPNLGSYGTAIGLQRYDYVDNTMLSSDIALLTAKLYKGELLNKEHTKLILQHMKLANRAQYIPAAVPAGVNVYHKAGWLNDRVHDVAIIEQGQNAFGLAIYTKVNGVFNESAGQKMAHDITTAAVETFIPKAKQ